MNLSEAMRLGSVMIERQTGTFAGCGLGVAAFAVGIKLPACMSELSRASEELVVRRELIKQWPWLNGPSVHCPVCDPHTNFAPPIVIIAHMFDSHVCNWHNRIPFPDLVSWVESIEPKGDSQSQAEEKEVIHAG